MASLVERRSCRAPIGWRRPRRRLREVVVYLRVVALALEVLAVDEALDALLQIRGLGRKLGFRV